MKKIFSGFSILIVLSVLAACNISGWSTYTNTAYNFELQYPPGGSIVPGATDYSVRGDLPFAAGTNLIEKYLDINVQNGVPTCEAPLAAGSLGLTTANTTIHGMPWVQQSFSNRGAGNFEDYTAYSTVSGSVCVSLTFLLHYANPEAYATPIPTFSSNESLVFPLIVATFQWLGGGATTPTPKASPGPGDVNVDVFWNGSSNLTNGGTLYTPDCSQPVKVDSFAATITTDTAMNFTMIWEAAIFKYSSTGTFVSETLVAHGNVLPISFSSEGAQVFYQDVPFMLSCGIQYTVLIGVNVGAHGGFPGSWFDFVIEPSNGTPYPTPGAQFVIRSTPTLVTTLTPSEMPASVFTPLPSDTPTSSALNFTPAVSPLEFNYYHQVSVLACIVKNPQVDISVMVSDPSVHGVVLFFRLKNKADGAETAWNAGVNMNPQGNGVFDISLSANQIPNLSAISASGGSAWLEYQFAATDALGGTIGRSPVYSNVSLTPCQG